jgi:hypothetical protein
MSARRWAVFNGLPVADFPADWKKFGKAAGMIRNAEMAAYADVVIAFAGGRGTDNMVEQGTKKGLRIIDLRDRPDLVRRIGNAEKLQGLRGVRHRRVDISPHGSSSRHVT